ncbi:MAG TPA: hypothetical protein PKA53_10535, partial [Sphingobacterium sp.]|nr:hypothetical protein [Sphingobacterium sp.]
MKLHYFTIALLISATFACSASKQTPKPEEEKPKEEEPEEPNNPNNKVIFFEDFTGSINEDKWGI